MPAVGQFNKLRVAREASQGMYLDAGELGEVLLPRRYVPKETNPGDVLRVFLYRDSEDRLVATTEEPYASVGDFAMLRVVSSDWKLGAFLDWGLMKDLLLPMREQERRVSVGEWVVVRVFLDPRNGRIVASSKLGQFLNRTQPLYDDGQKVRILIVEETPLGYRAIVENAHWGLLYHSEVHEPIGTGQRLRGYVRAVREDGKIDLSLAPSGYQRIAPLTNRIVEALKAGGGRLPLGDNSSPEEIRAAFSVSKKAFKQALGALYRQRRIKLTEQGIELLEENVFRPGRRE